MIAARAAAGATVAPAPLDPADPAHATLEELRAVPPSATAEHVESLAALIVTPRRISAALAALRIGAGTLASAAPLLGACEATAASREAVDVLVGNKPLADALAVASGAANQFANYFESGIEATPAPEHAEAVQTIKSVSGGVGAMRAALADPSLMAAAAALARLDVSAAADEPASATMAAVHTFLGNAEVGTAIAQAAATAESAAAFRAYLWPRAAAAVPAALRRLPPQDTFHRLNYYAEVNYESLRAVTEALYPERADLDWVIMPWAVFGGRPAEVDAEFDRFCSRHSEEFPSAVRSVDVGRWTFLGDFRGNRDKINFYNRNTEVLKRIMDRHEEDRKLGAELMRRRVEDKKLENIAEAGPDAAGLAGYRREAGGKGKTPAAMGAERVISAERMKRMEAARGDRAAMLELEQFTIYETKVADLERQLGDRSPTAAEASALAAARADLTRAREMLAVPNNAIQVDAFHFNAGTGEFDRKIMYTEAETPAETAERAAAAAGAANAPPLPLAPYAAAALEADLAAEREADIKPMTK